MVSTRKSTPRKAKPSPSKSTGSTNKRSQHAKLAPAKSATAKSATAKSATTKSATTVAPQQRQKPAADVQPDVSSASESDVGRGKRQRIPSKRYQDMKTDFTPKKRKPGDEAARSPGKKKSPHKKLPVPAGEDKSDQVVIVLAKVEDDVQVVESEQIIETQPQQIIETQPQQIIETQPQQIIETQTKDLSAEEEDLTELTGDETSTLVMAECSETELNEKTDNSVVTEVDKSANSSGEVLQAAFEEREFELELSEENTTTVVLREENTSPITTTLVLREENTTPDTGTLAERTTADDELESADADTELETDFLAEAAVYNLRPDGTLVKTSVPGKLRFHAATVDQAASSKGTNRKDSASKDSISFLPADPTLLMERPQDAPDPTQIIQQPAIMIDQLTEGIMSQSDLDTMNSMLNTMSSQPTTSADAVTVVSAGSSGDALMLSSQSGDNSKPATMTGGAKGDVCLDMSSLSDPDVVVEVIVDRSDPYNPTVRRTFSTADRTDTERSIVNGREIFTCSQCAYQTERRTNFYKHKKSHLLDRPYTCSLCEYSARTSTNLKRHMLTHTNERKFQCPKCPLKFKQKIHMDKHMNYIHGEKNIKCPYCEYMCANETPDLKLHLKRKHLKLNPDDPPTYLECSKCGFLAGSKKDLKQHSKFHRAGPELKLFCEECSFVTDAKSRLERHKRTHSQVKPFSCSHCDYRASQKEHIHRHMRTKHDMNTRETVTPKTPEQEKTNPTSDIPAVSNEKGESSSAGKRASTAVKYEPPDYSEKEKVFGCSHCTMKFVRLLSLYKHLHSQHADLLPDTEDEKLTCVVCDYKAANHKTLLVHMRRHNNMETDDAEIPGYEYGCVLCKYTNGKRRNLYQHLKKKHKISIMVRRDGTASCVVEHNAAVTVVASGEGQEVTEIVSVAGDGSSSEPNRIVNILDLANSLTQKHEVVPDVSEQLVVVDEEQTVESETVHAAAEAIVDLASQNVATSVDAASGDAASADSSDGTTESSAAAGTGEARVEMSNMQLNSLCSGDLIEINGESYKVEFADNVITATKQNMVTKTAGEDGIGLPVSEEVVMSATQTTE